MRACYTVVDSWCLLVYAQSLLLRSWDIALCGPRGTQSQAKSVSPGPENGVAKPSHLSKGAGSRTISFFYLRESETFTGPLSSQRECSSLSCSAQFYCPSYSLRLFSFPKGRKSRWWHMPSLSRTCFLCGSTAGSFPPCLVLLLHHAQGVLYVGELPAGYDPTCPRGQGFSAGSRLVPGSVLSAPMAHLSFSRTLSHRGQWRVLFPLHFRLDGCFTSCGLNEFKKNWFVYSHSSPSG